MLLQLTAASRGGGLRWNIYRLTKVKIPCLNRYPIWNLSG